MSRANSSFIVLALLFSLGAPACGGSDKPAKEPETAPVASAAPADMPPPPADTAATDAKPADGPAPGIPDPSASATLALPTATAKADLKGKKAAKVEVKADGTVANGGKAVAKVTGMTLQSPDGGKTFLTVGSDGAVTTGDGGSYGSFSGDDLTMAKGDKLTLGDDGTITMTTGGKAAPLGKFDGAGSAKRAVVLATAFVLAPPAAPAAAPAAKPAAGAAAPAAKPAAGAKPAAKPAGKK